MWRYIGINDLMRYAGAAILSGGMSWVVINLVFPDQPYSGDVFLLYILYLLLGLSASRSSFIILDKFYDQRFSDKQRENVLLYGAEDAGEIALRWIQRNPTIGYSVVGFLDE